MAPRLLLQLLRGFALGLEPRMNQSLHLFLVASLAFANKSVAIERSSAWAEPKITLAQNQGYYSYPYYAEPSQEPAPQYGSGTTHYRSNDPQSNGSNASTLTDEISRLTTIANNFEKQLEALNARTKDIMSRQDKLEADIKALKRSPGR